MVWRINDRAVADYLRLRRMDPRGSMTDAALVNCEMIKDIALLTGKKGRERSDGMVVYRGRQARRYQYIVDPALNELVAVRGESEVREQGSKGKHRGGGHG